MKLSKHEIITLREALKPLRTGLINIKMASHELFSDSPINSYRHEETEISLQDLKDLANRIDSIEEEAELIKLVVDCKEEIESHPMSKRLYWASKETATLALIKSGIRFGLQDNTKILLDNISYTDKPSITQDIAIALIIKGYYV